MLNLSIQTCSILLQTDLKNVFNNAYSGFITPIIVILLVIATWKGLINAIEMIMDREERGTTKDGWIKLGLIVLAIFALTTIAGIIIDKLKGMMSGGIF